MTAETISTGQAGSTLLGEHPLFLSFSSLPHLHQALLSHLCFVNTILATLLKYGFGGKIIIKATSPGLSPLFTFIYPGSPEPPWCSVDAAYVS